MPQKKLKIFLSYAHEDETMKKQLDKNLVMLKKSDKIEVWEDRAIIPGDVWDEKIGNALTTADIILLLISVDFNNSQYIWDKELKIALERHESDEARVIPVILRTCEWSEMPYTKLQVLPTNAKPISSFDDADEAYTDVAKGIRMVVDHILSQRATR
ncbi:MAG TPA: toll/interleukin-1 receptor domain-containing protein [Ferruginibacter sp.]|nr:toll/interleukin-1 receptor domain-containing protein [Ferruginibacter sp.]